MSCDASLTLNSILFGGHYGAPIGFSYAASEQFAVGR